MEDRHSHDSRVLDRVRDLLQFIDCKNFSMVLELEKRTAMVITHQTSLIANALSRGLKTGGAVACTPSTVDSHPPVVEVRLKAQPAVEEAEQHLKKISPVVKELRALLNQYEV